MKGTILSYNILSIKYLISFVLLFNSYWCFSQIFDGEQYPPSVQWRQINTENFQVIYPTTFEDEAQKLAGKLADMVKQVSQTLGKKPRKISIILQNQTVESNGFVQLAPRRSEFFTTPPQHGDFQEWLNNLAIHELRHVVQFDKLTGYLRAPLFEQLALAIFGITLPSWFFEGDAVITETVLSNSGRGRLPSWEMPMRTNLLSGAAYSYEKDYLGSLAVVTPGFYELGYFMTARLQREHGIGILDSLMTRMAHNPIRPYNFSNSLRKFTGHNTRKWHRETVNELTEKWQAQLEETHPQDYPIFPFKKDSKPESWLLPKHLGGGRIIALHQSAKKVPAIVMIDSLGKQKPLVKTGRQTAPNFTYAAGKITWDEVRKHGRYGKRTYSVVNLYDLQTRTYKQLTHRTRLFSPALHPDGQTLAAVEVNEQNQISLVILETEKGTVIGRFPSPRNIQLQTPAFDETGTKIVSTGVSQQGATLVELDVPAATYRLLLDWQAQQIERPVYAGIDRVVYKAHYHGIDNIYLFDRTSGSTSQLTHAKFGAFNPSVDSETNQLWFNNYQIDGYRISHLKWDDQGRDNNLKISDSHISYFSPLLSDEQLFWGNDTTTNEILPSKPYKGLKNLVNFHSLSVDNSNFSSINPGLYWLSDDLLNTTQIRLGYTYNGDIRSSEYSASLAYQRFFPKFSAEYLNRGQAGAARISNESDSLLAVRWREHLTTFRMEIPLVFYRLNSVYTTGLNVATSYTSRYGLNVAELQDRFINRIRFPLHYQFYVNHNVRRSTLDLAPRWGQNLSVTYRHFPIDGRQSGELFSFRSAFYFPGIVHNHSFLVRFSYQQGNGAYNMANDIPLVSGYDQLRPVPVNNTLLFNYRFPLAYPDWTIGPLAYIKRFKGGVFADFQNVRTGNVFSPRTFGVELRSDMNLLRFYLPNFDMGVKLIYANEPDARRTIFATYSIAYSY